MTQSMFVCVLSYIVDYAGVFIIHIGDISSMAVLVPLRASFFKGSSEKLISTNNMSKTTVCSCPTVDLFLQIQRDVQ